MPQNSNTPAEVSEALKKPTAETDTGNAEENKKQALEKLDHRAQNILRGNDYGGYTVPTKGLYPFQWNWDSCLAALGLAYFDEPRAWTEIETLFSGQWEDGMVPHIIFHKDCPDYFPRSEHWGTQNRSPQTSGITQPPVAASVMRKLVDSAAYPDAAKNNAQKLFDACFNWHNWFMTARDPQQTGLVAILHPWESGRDNNPDWDNALAKVSIDNLEPYQRKDTAHINADQRPRKSEYDRYMALVQNFAAHNWDCKVLHDISPFKVVDLGINSILLRAHKDLLWLAEELDRPVQAKTLLGWIATMEKAFNMLWDAEQAVFKSLDRITGERIDSTTSATFLPLYAGVAGDEQALSLTSLLDHWMEVAPFGVPSFSPDDMRFDALRYWRGPSWTIVNFMITDGLQAYGFDKLASCVADASRAAIAKSGFCEYFNPLDGTGLGGSDFTWTAAMWLAWLNPKQKEKQPVSTNNYKRGDADTRPWGKWEVIDVGPRFVVKRITVQPGHTLSLQLHHHRSEHWIIVDGMAKVTVGDEIKELLADESVYIPVKTKHRVENTSKKDMTFIEVQTGEILDENDIVRFEDSYGRV